MLKSITTKYFEKQKQAAQCHASQLDMGPPTLGSRIFRAFRNLAPSKDSFMRAYPPAEDEFPGHRLIRVLSN